MEPGTTMDEAMKELEQSDSDFDPAQNYTPMGSAEQYFLSVKQCYIVSTA